MVENVPPCSEVDVGKARDKVGAKLGVSGKQVAKLSEEAKERQRESGGDRKSAKAKSVVVNLPQPIPDADDTGKTRDQLGKLFGVSGSSVDKLSRRRRPAARPGQRRPLILAKQVKACRYTASVSYTASGYGRKCCDGIPNQQGRSAAGPPLTNSRRGSGASNSHHAHGRVPGRWATCSASTSSARSSHRSRSCSNSTPGRVVALPVPMAIRFEREVAGEGLRKSTSCLPSAGGAGRGIAGLPAAAVGVYCGAWVKLLFQGDGADEWPNRAGPRPDTVLAQQTGKGDPGSFTATSGEPSESRAVVIGGAVLRQGLPRLRALELKTRPLPFRCQ